MTIVPASAVTTASFGNGTLTVSGDNLDNSIVISRNAAGQLLVNGGAVAVNQANGALPRANVFGGTGNDTFDGGAGNDLLFRRP